MLVGYACSAMGMLGLLLLVSLFKKASVRRARHRERHFERIFGGLHVSRRSNIRRRSGRWARQLAVKNISTFRERVCTRP